MDHEQRRQRQQHSPRGNAPGSGRCGTSSGKHKGGSGKGGGKKPIKVVYISNPMRVKTSAAGFRALVQELTGRDADPSKYSPEDLAGAADAAVAAADLDCAAAQGFSPGGAAASSEIIVAIPSPAAVDHLSEAAVEAVPHGGDYYYDEEEEDGDGFGSQLLENNYTVFSPPTLLYDHHPHSKYVLDTSVLPHEPECMRDLRHETNKHQWCLMQSSPDEAQLLQMLIKLTGARKTLEVGVFTGYSLLATALALPADGKVIAMDINRADYDIGRPFIERAGVAGKVDFREGPALETLEQLLADEANHGAFDLAFVDADKPNYVRYHEQLLRLVRVGGIIVYDNTLWCGTVAWPPETPMHDMDRRFSAALRDLNARLSADDRVEVCQLAIADGVSICRRVV